jgi:hypothetical protein
VLRCKEMALAMASAATAWDTGDHSEKLLLGESFSNLIRGMVVVATMAVEEEEDSKGAVVTYHVVEDTAALTDSLTPGGNRECRDQTLTHKGTCVMCMARSTRL